MIVSALKWTGAAALGLTVLVGPVFVYGWAGHMEQVREWQLEDVAQYQERSTDWNTVDSTDLDMLVDLANEEILAVIRLGVGGLRDEGYVLRDAATEVLFLIRSAGHENTTPDQDVLNAAVKEVADAQQRMYDAHDRFQSNWFFAMAVTL